jgi:hypothetical protein
LQPAVFPFVRHLRIPVNMTVRCGTEETIPLLVGFYRVVSLNVDLFWRSLDTINAQSWSILGKNLSGVVSLSLKLFYSANTSSLARVICALPCLRELFIRGVENSELPGLPSATMFRLPPPSSHL